MSRRRHMLLTRLASFTGASLLSMGVTVSTALGAWTPITPDMFGSVPNYANSPLPVATTTTPPVLNDYGNAINADQPYATDYPPLTPDATALAQVMVVVPSAVLPTGTLKGFSTWNQATAGSSPTPSAGDGVQTNGKLYAYVLRPTGVANEYSVVYQSGQLQVPAVITAGTSEVFTTAVPDVPVQLGDVIGFYGEGVPITTGSGTDVLSYPAPTAPATGGTFTLGGAGFPIIAQPRTYAIAATVDTGTAVTTISGGMRKFMDSLPQLDTANNLGQQLPIAVPDTTTYPGSDYYEIEYREYNRKLHSDLPATRLRGYHQVNLPAGVTDPGPQYLGPIIVATKDRPVRVKYINNLPTGSGGDLFIPTDTTYMGAGNFEVSSDLYDSQSPTITGTFAQNRSSTHLHGGATPWISDGTPHQWNTPAGEYATQQIGVSYGDSKADTPDMWFVDGLPLVGANDPDNCNLHTTCATAGATNDPGPGMTTYFYTNQQSARLMFYHDHALGVTRLNVYAGMAGGYLNTDSTEQALINGGTVSYTDPVTGDPASATFTAGTLPDLGIPLVIQDKTFVPPTAGGFTNLVGTFPSQLDAQDPTWDVTNWGGEGQLWFPHVYMPNQNPYDLSGANAMGRWDYGPWFWPPFTGIQFGEIANPYYDPACDPAVTYCEPPFMPGTPDARKISPSGTPESFMDTAMVNGTAYPYIEVDPTVVRFRILSVANDRFQNLSLFVAADKNSPTTAGTTGTVLCDGTSTVNPADCTEVKMVPFNSSYDASCPASADGPGCFPSWWYTRIANGFTFDDRDGGVPDPVTRGPAMIQIGTEGGFLPGPVVIPNQPVNYVYNRRDIVVGNINEHALLLAPAERADVVVDFSQFAGQTLILYNDSPAPVPAADPRLDYYTGDPDQTDTGGAPSTLPGYGPNIRTVMQIRVRGSGGPGGADYVNPAVLASLEAALPLAFRASQEPIIVPQAAYAAVYPGQTPTVDKPSIPPSTTDPDGTSGTVVRIQDNDMTLTPIGQAQLTLALQPKAIIEDFTVDYGRMNALLGVEIPHTNNTNQTSLIEAYIDPPTELVKLTASNGTPDIGTAADGTQLWKITHNGVDTHAMHFHMFHVQVVNRVGWDGAIRLPDANELGWKDTVRMNPLEDVIVAMRPKALLNTADLVAATGNTDAKGMDFQVVNSWRPLDPTQPLNAQWQALEPTATLGAVTVTNTMTNFGWEHVWHCHILGHEENDMMRALVIDEPPVEPSNLTATASGGNAVLNWLDNSVNETSFTLQKSSDPTFPAASTTSYPLGPDTTTYTDVGAALSASYYRVMASNTVGADPISAPGYSQLTADSVWSNTAQIPQVPVAAVTPLTLTFADQVVNTTSAPQPVTLTNTGVVALTFTPTVTGDFAQTNGCGGTVAVGASCTINVTFTPTVAGVRTGTLDVATNDPANPTLTVTLSGTGLAGVTVPAVPTNLTGVAVRLPFGTPGRNANDAITLNWIDNANNETGFTIQRAQVGNSPNACTNPNLAFSTVGTVGVNVTTYNEIATRTGNLCYRVAAFNAAGSSAWSNVVRVVTP